MGLIDDLLCPAGALRQTSRCRWVWPPSSRFSSTCGCLEFLGNRWGIAGGAASALSVLWIVIVTNAMNSLDNMDGLAGGVGRDLCRALSRRHAHRGPVVRGRDGRPAAGGIAGAFLIFNFPPAKVFMPCGDGSGSLRARVPAGDRLHPHHLF